MSRQWYKEYKESVNDINNPTLEELERYLFVTESNYDLNPDGWSLHHTLKLLIEKVKTL